MSAKSRKFDFRTMLYIIIILLILVAAAYLILGDNEESATVYSPIEVLTNKNNFVNKNIIVEGIYYSDGDYVGEPTSDDNPNPTFLLRLDITNVNNFTTLVQDGNKYKFSGTLNWATDTPVPNTDVILLVSEIDAV